MLNPIREPHPATAVVTDPPVVQPPLSVYPRRDASKAHNDASLRGRLVDAYEAAMLNLRRLEREAVDYVPPGEVRRRSMASW